MKIEFTPAAASSRSGELHVGEKVFARIVSIDRGLSVIDVKGRLFRAELPGAPSHGRVQLTFEGYRNGRALFSVQSRSDLVSKTLFDLSRNPAFVKNITQFGFLPSAALASGIRSFALKDGLRTLAEKMKNEGMHARTIAKFSSALDQIVNGSSLLHVFDAETDDEEFRAALDKYTPEAMLLLGEVSGGYGFFHIIDDSGEAQELEYVTRNDTLLVSFELSRSGQIHIVGRTSPKLISADVFIENNAFYEEAVQDSEKLEARMRLAAGRSVSLAFNRMSDLLSAISCDTSGGYEFRA